VFAVVLASSAFAQLGGRKPFGVPNFGEKSAWTVFSCPDAGDCPVPVEISIVNEKCQYVVYDVIDRHPNQKKQELVWILSTPTTGYEVRFGNANLTKPGIEIRLGKGDMDDKKNDKKEHRKKFKKQDTLFITYDIHAEFRRTTDTDKDFTPCDDKGPAIINRG
jgi:hypothetical protein